jgi:two-component system, LytTR family, sensor kinase
VSPWLVIPGVALLATLSGTYSYFLQRWINPEVVNNPIGQYRWVLLFNLLFWTWWVGLMSAVLLLGRRVRITRANAVRVVAFHVAVALCFATVHGMACGSLRYMVFWLCGYFDLPSSMPLTVLGMVKTELLNSFEGQLLIYAGIIATSHVIEFNNDLQQQQVRQSRLQARLVEAQLESLQRQLNPHFLFNTLHAIASVVHRDPDAADAMIIRLGDLLRAVFCSDVQQEVPLTRELELLEQYLSIQRLRFGGSLRTELHIAPDIGTTRVPILLLQPLVENSIAHGFRRTAAGGIIRITAVRRDGSVEITVADNGRSVNPDQLRGLNEGVGLSNTRARLEHLYPNAHTLSFHAPSEGGFAVTIVLPGPPAAEPADESPRLQVPA